MQDATSKQIQVAKALNEELMQATFVVLVHDAFDAHGHIVTETEVRKACFNFNKFCRKPNLFHLAETDSYECAESYVSPTDMFLGERFVKKGTWLATVQVLDEKLWELIKDGSVNGLSIGAMGYEEVIE